MTFPLAVTTSVNPTPALEERAQGFSVELHAPYIPRRNVTVARLLTETEASRLLIVGTESLRLRDRESGGEYFYHPNMLQVRGYNVRRGENDGFVLATGLMPGDSLLDCTLGFASEASLGALIVGETGRVVGLESVPELAVVTREGLQTFPMQAEYLAEAMRRVEVVTADYREYLCSCSEHSVDVVYFDPFFPKRLAGSEHSVSPLAAFGNLAPLEAQSVTEARRVARRRVVVKHPTHVPLPGSLASDVSETVSSRKSRIVYSILPALSAPPVAICVPERVQ